MLLLSDRLRLQRLLLRMIYASLPGLRMHIVAALQASLEISLYSVRGTRVKGRRIGAVLSLCDAELAYLQACSRRCRILSLLVRRLALRKMILAKLRLERCARPHSAPLKQQQWYRSELGR